MSVFSAMTTAVSGLNAQSRAIGNISDNIANSSTTGFKRVDTSFISMVTTSNKNYHAPGSVIARPQFRNQVQGDVVSSTVPTNVAISGSGYFIVSRSSKIDSSGTATFDPQTLYTRRGDFAVTLDSNGYMINGAGYYLQGRKVVDQVTRDPVGAPEVIQVNQQTIPAEPTTTINYNANLPSGLAVLPASLRVGSVPSGAALTTIPSAQVSSFVSSSVSGGSATAYDALGHPVDIQMRWAKSSAAGGGSTLVQTANVNANDTISFTVNGSPQSVTATSDLDALVSQINSGGFGVTAVRTDAGGVAAATGNYLKISGNQLTDTVTASIFTDVDNGATAYTGTDTAPVATDQWDLYAYDPTANTWTQLIAPGSVTFDPTTGLMNGPYTAANSAVTIDGNSIAAGAITLNFGSATTMTQFDATDSTIQRLDQDGHPLGQLASIEVDDRGYVVASYDNGVNMTLYQIALAQFPNENALDRRDGEAFLETADSGAPQIRRPGEIGAGTVSGSSLENSNVDIADEFTKMIVAQRSYSANSRVVTTADEMLQEVINMKR